jgi:hypothetical protein
MILPERAVNWFAAAAVAALLAGGPSGAAELPDPVRFGVAIEMGDLRAASAWLDAGLPPDFMADRIGTGLMIAAWEGNIPMMALFLSRGADLHKTNRFGEQALMHAAWKGRLEAVRWLLDRGARVNRDGREWSALHYAVFAGHEAVARLLIERGADVNARAPNGSTVLMMAAREGREGLARMLVERGADTQAINERGEDALAWAMRHGHLRIARLVAGPERFARAARQPSGSFGTPVRSAPLSPRIESLLSEMQLNEALGHLTPETKRDYLAAIEGLRREEEAQARVQAPPPREPKRIEIRARRGQPDRQEAVLIDERRQEWPLP